MTLRVPRTTYRHCQFSYFVNDNARVGGDLVDGRKYTDFDSLIPNLANLRNFALACRTQCNSVEQLVALKGNARRLHTIGGCICPHTEISESALAQALSFNA
jgi:hypothetical protein